MSVETVLAPGTRLAGYTLGRVVGRGGMSVVYEAHDERLDRRVALKVLAPRLRESDSFRTRFLRESRLAASLDHAHVVPVYEAGEAENVLYLAMRLVPGSDLRALLDAEAPLEPRRALDLLGQVAGALDAAHDRGLLHRDVKPANILLAIGEGRGTHVYLSDFGLAVPDEDGRGLAGGGFGGSADYVAPEQVQGHAERRSDVYGLACVLFECLTGEPPFGRRRLLETLWAHLNEEPPRLSERRPGTPAAADEVIAAALDKDPEARPATCAELVGRARQAFGLDARRPRRRAVAALALVLAVVPLALVLGVLRPWAEAEAVSSAGPTITTVAGTGTDVSSGDGGPAVDAGLKSPFSLAVDGGGNLYVWEADETSVRRMDARDGTIRTVAGSLDGGLAIRTHWDQVGLAVDGAGRLHLLRWGDPALLRLRADGTLETVAGTGRGGILDEGLHTRSDDLCQRPEGPAFDPSARVYVVCSSAHRVIRIDAPDSFTVVAGTGTPGSSGDGGPATAAQLHRPAGIAIDREGNLFIADSLNHRIRRVDREGTITTVAGTGRPGLSGDGWRATAVDLWTPTRVRVDGAGNLYVLEAATYRVRKVDRAGRITTVAGTGRRGYGGDGGPAAEAELSDPTDIAVGADGTVWIADSGNHRIRKVSP